MNNQMLIESRLQMIQEELLNREYREFFHAINRYGIHNLNRRLDEGRIMDTIKSKMGFIKEVGELLKTEVTNIIEILKNKNVFRFFSEIKWSIKYFNDMMKKSHSIFTQVSSDVKEYIAQYRAKHPMIKDDAILRKVHDYIRNHHVLSKVAGKHLKYFLMFISILAVAGLGMASISAFNLIDASAITTEVTQTILTLKTPVLNVLFYTTAFVVSMGIFIFAAAIKIDRDIHKKINSARKNMNLKKDGAYSFTKKSIAKNTGPSEYSNMTKSSKYGFFKTSNAKVGT
jgi:hypothetical protein